MADILFICSGNTCRSPMAAHIAAAVAVKEFPDAGFRFDSAGLAAVNGFPASENAVAALAEWDIDLTAHVSRSFQRWMLDAADVVVCMTTAHKEALLAAFPDAAAKIFFIGEAAGSGRDVPDPYGGDLELYRRTRDVLYTEIKAILTRMSKEDSLG